MKKFFRAIHSKLPSKARVAGAIQGVIGDKLPEKMRLQMKLFYRGAELEDFQIVARPHICIFVHGSSDTEAGWAVKSPGSSFGERLLLDFGVEPVYLRYNSGLKISDNGEKLSALVEELLLRNKSIRKISFIGHSMGGLIVHSAIYHGVAQTRSWVKKIKQVFLLGTPHVGAPLAKFAEKSEQILQFIPNPFTLIAASVIGLRSGGLKDLSQGEMGLPAKGKVLLPRVRYVFIAGGVQKKAKGILNRLMGDGMVRTPSAHARHTNEPNWLKKAVPWLNRSGDVRIEEVPGIGHLGLRSAPAVYAVISSHFRA